MYDFTMSEKRSTEERLTDIETRNHRVENEKSWEVSWTRRLSIAGLTYVVVAVYLTITHNPTPYANALVPAVGFLLSTLVLPGIRTIWQKKQKK